MRSTPVSALLLLAVLGGLVPLAATAAVPAQVQLEGLLSTAGGLPATDGDYPMTFAIYAAVDAADPVWTEGPVTLAVKGGLYAHALGSAKPLDAGALGKLATPFLGVKIADEPELPRKPLHSTVYALRAGLADGLDCSGCLTAQHLSDQVLAPYAKSANLAKVAGSGQYADLAGLPDLGLYAKTASLADVALTGNYADLSGTPTFGKACGTGLVVQGIKADGTLECVAGLDPAKLPADTLDKISQGVLSNFISSAYAGAGVPKDIPDNNPIGIGDLITVPDIGKITSVSVNLKLTNSDHTGLKVVLAEPGGTKFVLWEGGKGAGALDTTFPKPTAPASGDFSTLVGKSPAGKWALTVADTKFKDNGTDGQLLAWGLTFNIHSDKSVQVNGSLVDAAGHGFARVAYASSDALGGGKTLTVVTGSNLPAVTAQAWTWDESGSRWVQAQTASSDVICQGCGTGAEGDFVSNGNTTLAGGTRNFKSFTIKAGDTVTVTGGNPLDLLVQGKVEIAGTLNLAGGRGTDANTCCPDNPGGAGGGGGGAAGGTGSGSTGNTGGGSGGGSGGCASGYGAGGGGAGHAGNGSNGTTSPNSCSPGGNGGGAYGSETLANGLEPGSGGGAGGYGSAANSAGSGGGGGGGAVRITAGSIVVTGTITADGGAGGDVVADRDGGAGGGGSGGSVWLRGTSISVSGKVTAAAGAGGKSDKLNGYGGDGGNGAAGRIRLDGFSVTASGQIAPQYVTGATTGLAAPGAKLRVDQKPAGTVVLTNEGEGAAKVYLVVHW